MKKLLGICLITSVLSSCVSTRTCSRRQLESIKAQSHTDGVYYSSKIDELTSEWISEYCRMAISEESKIAKLTNSKTISIPQMCVDAVNNLP